MELTLESAFSFGGGVGHLSYLLLVISMMMRRMGPLRVLAILSSLAAIAYDAIWLKDPVGLFWETLLVLVNVYQLSALWLSNRRARFTAQERELVDSRFLSLPPGYARGLLDRGEWVDLPAGSVLAVEGRPVAHLHYLAAGEAVVSYRGHDFAYCRPGVFVGEMTVLEEEPATADVRLSAPARCWRIEAEALRRAHRQDETMASSLAEAFAIDWKEKLVAHRERSPSPYRDAAAATIGSAIRV